MLQPLDLNGVKGIEGPSLGAVSIFNNGQGQEGPLTSMQRNQALQPSFTGAPSAYDTGDVVGAAATNIAARAGTSAALNALQNSLAGAENLVYAGGQLVPMDVAMGDVLPFSAYGGSVLRLLQGDVKGAAGSAVGTYLGSFFGPVGTFLGGLLGGGCFITEAVLSTVGGEDDQPVLEALRWFRDNRLMNSVEGVQLVNQYYKTAPKIVEQLSRRKDRREIYAGLYDNYILPAAKAVAQGDDRQALALYSAMIAETSQLTGVRGLKTAAMRLAKGAE